MTEQNHDNVEQPVAYRVSWDYVADRLVATLRKSKRPPASQNFATREDAEYHRKYLRAVHGDCIVICLTPVYITPSRRAAHYDSRQQTAAAGWPLQHRPAKSKPKTTTADASNTPK